LGQGKPEGWPFPQPRALHAEDPSRRPPSDSGQGKYSEEGPHQPLGTGQVYICGRKPETAMPLAHLPQHMG